MAETSKFWSMGILFLVSCLSGLIVPFIVIRILSNRCHSMKKLKFTLSLLNCFSGGVFIATALLILFPEGQEIMEESLELLSLQIDYPVTELLAGFGFLLILFIESVVTTCHERQKHNRNNTPSAQTTNDNNINVEVELSTSYHNSDNTVYTIEQTRHCQSNNEDNDTGADDDDDDNADDDEIRNDSDTRVYNNGLTIVQNIALFIALSIHMLFDGLSLGLLQDAQQVWSLLLALTFHKLLIFFSIGLHFCENMTTCKFAFSMIYISLVSPFGTGIGILMSTHQPSVTMTTISAVLQSIAAGTFMYVAIFEILLKEFSLSRNQLLKSIFVIAGYVFFAIIKYVVP
ncbi:hypothetical protein ACF0H5_000798 [Mactra antiquata]